MLTTSRWSAKLPSPLGSIAQSIACVTRFVDPLQPKILSANSCASGATPGPIPSVEIGVPAFHGPANVLPSAFSP